VIDAGGNVGIGTTGPGNKLAVADPGTWIDLFDTSSAAIDQGGQLNFSGYMTGTSATSNYALISGAKENGTSANSAGYINFFTNGGGGAGNLVERVRINSSGNVGIGTTSPAAKLAVDGLAIFGQPDKTDVGQITVTSSSDSDSDTPDGYGISYGSASTDSRSWRIVGDQSGWGYFDIEQTTTQAGSTFAAKLTIDLNGNVGIGDSSPSEAGTAGLVVGSAGAGQVYATFAVSGNSETLCWDNSGASLITDCTSLSKFKENVTPLGLSGLETVMQLSPREYDWIGKEEGIKHDLGFVAEEVEAVSPLLASYSIRDGVVELNGVKYERMTALIVKAIQEMWGKIVNHEGRIEKLERENEKLRARIEKLEKMYEKR
jgi:hypothetical protein